MLAILKYPNPAPGESWSPAVRDAAQLDLAATAGTQNEECIKQKLMVALTLEGINGKAMDEEEYFKIKGLTVLRLHDLWRPSQVKPNANPQPSVNRRGLSSCTLVIGRPAPAHVGSRQEGGPMTQKEDVEGVSTR